MININVEVDCNLWLNEIKNPKNYLKKKINKISKIYPFNNNKKITFTILLTNTLKIKKLNNKFRNVNRSTDVLSFPFYSPRDLKIKKEKKIYLGDIATCYDFVNKRSQNSNFFLEFDKLWVHGFLHLLGYNHIQNRDYFKMNKIEKRIINSIAP